MGMDGSGFGAVVRGGAGWEDVADEAVSVCTFYLLSLPFHSHSYYPMDGILLPLFLSIKRREGGRGVRF
jgi:hypothetical protein